MAHEISTLGKGVTAKKAVSHVISYVDGFRIARGQAPQRIHVYAKFFDAPAKEANTNELHFQGIPLVRYKE